ncbi:FitA-like ribbon-helix-helix domain-containing protein [Panacagrimonas sp.]|uniref:FitA-like ribbon-helix-helix domain-containing protein n=1 Tax=Panacagrimonas sp. TaxID=2480088 RepID=UPI003B524E3F
MPTLTIRNVTSEVHRALRVRAAQHGRSTEAEVRAILATAVDLPQRAKVGTELRKFFHAFPELQALQLDRNATPAEPADYT